MLTEPCHQDKTQSTAVLLLDLAEDHAMQLCLSVARIKRQRTSDAGNVN